MGYKRLASVFLQSFTWNDHPQEHNAERLMDPIEKQLNIQLTIVLGKLSNIDEEDYI